MSRTQQPVFNLRCRKVGGIWFLRIGRFQFSFCLCRAEPRCPWTDVDWQPHRGPR